jgi:hypothetical protein
LVLVSAEIRWFWRNALPPGLDAWFRNGAVPPGGGSARTDEYLFDPGQVELGVKRRGPQTGVEIKGLVALRSTTAPPLNARVQIWSKWTSQTLSLANLPTIAVRKTRWIRKFDTGSRHVLEVPLDAQERPRDPEQRPERGCQLELVALSVESRVGAWWSLAFEAFGEVDTVETSLGRTLAHVAPGAPTLESAMELSYPAWLAALAG